MKAFGVRHARKHVRILQRAGGAHRVTSATSKNTRIFRRQSGLEAPVTYGEIQELSSARTFKDLAVATDEELPKFFDVAG